MSKKTTHTIYKFRLTNEKRCATSISRIYYCEAKDMLSLKTGEGGYHDDDIILLYSTFDDKDHDDYEGFFGSLDESIPFLSETDVKRIDDLNIIKLPRNYIHRDEIGISDANERALIPRLDPDQKRLYDYCERNPPFVVHGPAGSGKTLISEKLYCKCSRNGKRCLYVTYMGRLKLQVEENLKSLNLSEIECVTMDDLVERFLPDYYRGGKYKIESDFRKWVDEDAELNQHCKQDKYGGTRELVSKINKDRDLAISIAYIFFRTFSDKGDYYSFNDDPKLRVKGEAENRFLKSCEFENGLSLDAKKRVFYLCQKYEQYLKSKGYIYDNEAARLVSYKKEHNMDVLADGTNEAHIPNYDVIIVDEVQDLTGSQIDCLTTLLNKDHEKKYFYAFGDDNQSINPTLIDISNVRTRLGKNLGVEVGFPEDVDKKTQPLNKSFRNSTYMLDYINYLNKKRRDSIATGKAYNEQKIKPVIESENNESDYPVFTMDGDLSDACLSMSDIMINNEVVIITANARTKAELLEKHKHLDIKDAEYVCTIEETKGREWDHVILYNFFTSTMPIWEDITVTDEEKASGKKGSGNHSSIYRMFFNRYYVGLTRAKRKVIIMETGKLSPKIRRTYFPKYSDMDGVSLGIFKDPNTFRSYFDNDHTHDIWDKEAANLFKRRDYEEALARQRKAIVALEKSMGPGDITAIKRTYVDKCEKYSAYMHVSSRDVAPESVQSYLVEFINDRNTEFMGKLYDAVGDVDKARLLRTDPRRDFELYLELFENLRTRLTDIEKDYFNSNAIIAYEGKISKIKREV